LATTLSSKNQNPREGIETRRWPSPRSCRSPASKNQNPREGIETRSSTSTIGIRSMLLQKTKIPARGLKPNGQTNGQMNGQILQKTKIPARGLKLAQHRRRHARRVDAPSKNQNPREGIETREHGQCARAAHCDFKKPKSPRGD